MQATEGTERSRRAMVRQLSTQVTAVPATSQPVSNLRPGGLQSGPPLQGSIASAARAREQQHDPDAQLTAPPSNVELRNALAEAETAKAQAAEAKTEAAHFKALAESAGADAAASKADAEAAHAEVLAMKQALSDPTLSGKAGASTGGETKVSAPDAKDAVTDAEAAKVEATAAKQEAETAESEADVAKKESEAAKAEAAVAKQQAATAKSEADVAKKESEAARAEAARDAKATESDAAKANAAAAGQALSRDANAAGQSTEGGPPVASSEAAATPSTASGDSMGARDVPAEPAEAATRGASAEMEAHANARLASQLHALRETLAAEISELEARAKDSADAQAAGEKRAQEALAATEQQCDFVVSSAARAIADAAGAASVWETHAKLKRSEAALQSIVDKAATLATTVLPSSFDAARRAVASPLQPSASDNNVSDAMTAIQALSDDPHAPTSTRVAVAKAKRCADDALAAARNLACLRIEQEAASARAIAFISTASSPEGEAVGGGRTSGAVSKSQLAIRVQRLAASRSEVLKRNGSSRLEPSSNVELQCRVQVRCGEQPLLDVAEGAEFRDGSQWVTMATMATPTEGAADESTIVHFEYERADSGQVELNGNEAALECRVLVRTRAASSRSPTWREWTFGSALLGTSASLLARGVTQLDLALGTGLGYDAGHVPAETPEDLVGRRIECHSLENETRYNGCVGKCLSWNHERRRLIIKLDTDPQQLAVEFKNVREVATAVEGSLAVDVSSTITAATGRTSQEAVEATTSALHATHARENAERLYASSVGRLVDVSLELALCATAAAKPGAAHDQPTETSDQLAAAKGAAQGVATAALDRFLEVSHEEAKLRDECTKCASAAAVAAKAAGYEAEIEETAGASGDVAATDASARRGTKEADHLASALGSTTMQLDGLKYRRIWHNANPDQGQEGGAFDMTAAEIQSLAAASTSIHIRQASAPEQYVTLKPGVQWPLQKLARGEPFDMTLEGGDVTKENAAATWSGSRVDAMWNTNRPKEQALTIEEGMLYWARNNPNGLHCKASRPRRCRFAYQNEHTEDVEVWLGRNEQSSDGSTHEQTGVTSRPSSRDGSPRSRYSDEERFWSGKKLLADAKLNDAKARLRDLSQMLVEGENRLISCSRLAVAEKMRESAAAKGPVGDQLDEAQQAAEARLRELQQRLRDELEEAGKVCTQTPVHTPSLRTGTHQYQCLTTMPESHAEWRGCTALAGPRR